MSNPSILNSSCPLEQMRSNAYKRVDFQIQLGITAETLEALRTWMVQTGMLKNCDWPNIVRCSSKNQLTPEVLMSRTYTYINGWIEAQRKSIANIVHR